MNAWATGFCCQIPALIDNLQGFYIHPLFDNLQRAMWSFLLLCGFHRLTTNWLALTYEIRRYAFFIFSFWNYITVGTTFLEMGKFKDKILMIMVDIGLRVFILNYIDCRQSIIILQIDLTVPYFKTKHFDNDPSQTWITYYHTTLILHSLSQITKIVISFYRSARWY